ncbi:MAG TPA: hypothetical protein PLY95_01190 [Candidatus Paceibacterota bacterium]|nr:hypothetical protein [Candidatus Paceibacterota bacterium]
MWIPLALFGGFLIFWLARNMKSKAPSQKTGGSEPQPQTQPSTGAAAAGASQGTGASNPPAAAPAQQSLGQKIASYVVAAVIIATIVLGLVWLGRPKALVETPAAAAFKHGFEVKVAAGPWRKVEEVDWAKVKSTFTIPAKGNIHCDQAVNAGKRLHYAIRQPDGVIIEMKPLGEQSPEDKKQEVTAPVGAVVQVTSLTGEELSLLIQY